MHLCKDVAVKHRAYGSPTLHFNEADPVMNRAFFHQALKRKFGTILNAWRALDSHGHGRVSFSEFCRSSRSVGSVRDPQSLFKVLDTRKDGFLTLDEIDI